jgi:uncharacterized surface protein with fasciclin (FAS1) repeats
MIRRLLMLSAAAASLAACRAEEGAAGNGASAAGPAGDSSTGGGGNSAAGATIGETAAQTAELGQFSQALQSAGLTETFRRGEPYTVFAPVNSAFEAIPQETRTRLMAAEGRAQLTRILTYHVVAGEIGSQDLAQAMERNQGRATLSTIAGENLTVTREGDALVVSDAAGGKARIVQPDRRGSNGVIHQIDAVLMPGGGPDAGAAGNTQ